MDVTVCLGLTFLHLWSPAPHLYVRTSAASEPVIQHSLELHARLSSLSAHLPGSIHIGPQQCQFTLFACPSLRTMASGDRVRALAAVDDDTERALYNSLVWQTSTPPPLTVYLRPYLRHIRREMDRAVPQQTLCPSHKRSPSSTSPVRRLASSPPHGTPNRSAPGTFSGGHSLT